MSDPGSASSLAALSERVLAGDEARRRAAAPAEVTLPGDLLPGIGDPPMRLREALRAGGVATLVVLTLLSVTAAMERGALVVLGPDIQKTLGVSDGVLAAISGASGALFVLGAVPFGVLADRVARLRLAAVASLAWSACLAASGAVVNGFQFFCIRLATGLGQSNELPVHGGVLADRYPIAARGRVFAAHGSAQSIGAFVGPLAAGGLTVVVGGPSAWRWVFVILAVPPALLGLLAAALPEPARGAHEQAAVLGEVAAPTDELPVSVSAAFERLGRIRTFRHILLAEAVLGFALFSSPVLISLFLRDRFGLSAVGRGTVFSLAALGPIVVTPFVGAAADRILRRDPGRLLPTAGVLLAAFGLVLTAALFMPNTAATTVMLALAQALATGAFVALNPVVAAVVPYRLRSQGFALIGVYLFLFGAFAGLLLAGALSDVFGERTALVALAPAAGVVSGFLLALGRRHVARDISLVVEELLEEQADARRRTLGDAVPVLDVRNLDFSYGNVQVLFDVSLEVRRGEVVALVGTNGAGKSTLLRVISGLGVPQRGVVRFAGRTITLVDPERRGDLGIIHVRGGAGVFPDLSVDENLDTFLLRTALTPAERRERRRRVFDAFPRLEQARRTPVRELSGGQQQQVALSFALLRPAELLIIDELSLGLAPVVVEELLEIVDGLRTAGTSMLIVEQSLNIAAAIADRAVFMEKGAVRYDGPARDLLERAELARAVFLGGHGGHGG